MTSYCNTLIGCVYNFQPLIAGAYALVAAFITAQIIWRAARLPVDAQTEIEHERKSTLLQYYFLAIVAELETLIKRTEQSAATIRVVAASNSAVNDEVKSRTSLPIPELLEKPEVMSIFPTSLARKSLNLRRKIDAYNFDISRSGGAFGASNFRESLFKQLKSIELIACGLVHDANEGII